MFVIVVGGGKVGSYLASLLLAGGHQVRIIESGAEQLGTLRRDLPPDVVVAGSGTDPRVLEASGIRQADTLAAVSGVDETNLAAASLARFEFGVPRIIARVNHPRNAWLFTPEMGVDAALNQADLIAHMVVEEMSLGDVTTLLKLRKGQYSLVEERLAPAAAAVGKAVADLRMPQQCLLVAIIRQGQLVLPLGDTVLEPGDEILALVHASRLRDFAASLDGQPV
ncbi:MAG: TrkA family potassium uptake protein [Anaerolineae bacterium]